MLARSIILLASITLFNGCVSNGAKNQDQVGRYNSAGQVHTGYSYKYGANSNYYNNSKLFYLVRTGDSWSASFFIKNIRDENVEVLRYWPSTRQVVLAFEHGVTTRQNGDGLCTGVDFNRSKWYSICSSNFKKPSGGGKSSIDNSARSIEGWYTIDSQQILGSLSQINLDELLGNFTYQNDYAKLESRSGILNFISKYSNNDPRGLVAGAKDKLRHLDENNAALANAEIATPKLDVYVKKYTPKSPVAYCNSLRNDVDLFEQCRINAETIVRSLALEKSIKARNYDICNRVSLNISGSQQPSLCSTYRASNNCISADPGLNSICEIITKRGQS